MAAVDLSAGDSIATAMAAASAGDVLVLGTGTYAGAFTCKAVIITAAAGADVVITGSVTAPAAGLAVLYGCTLTAASHTLQTGSMTFYDCTFGQTALGGNDAGIFTFYGCTFGSLYYELLGTSHTFAGCFLDGGLYGDSGNAACTFSGCTFRSVTPSEGWLVDVDTVLAENNIWAYPVSVADPFLFAVQTSGTIRNNVYTTNFTDIDSLSNSTETNNKVVIDCKLRASGRIEYDSPARNHGTGTPLATYTYDRQRMPAGVDAGCYMYLGDTTELFAPWQLTDPAFGLNMSDATAGAMVVTLTPGIYKDNYDIGARIAESILRHFAAPAFHWGFTADYGIYLNAPYANATNTLTTSAHAARVFGVLSQTDVTDVELGRTARHLTTDLAWEAPITPYIPAKVEAFDFGQSEGTALPAGSTRRICRMRVWTNPEDTVSARTLFNRWFSGSPLRVYRRTDETAQWTVTNTHGFDDLVAFPLDDGDYAWYTTNMTSYEIEFTGLAEVP